MSILERDHDPRTDAPPRKGFKSLLLQAEGQFSFLKGLTLLSAFGTLIGAYFQNLSAYESKVAAQAQTDLAGATRAFEDTSLALVAPIRLQWQLIKDYHNAIQAGTDGDAKGFETADARETYKIYTAAYADLSKNYNLLARKAELYIDMPSDLDRRPEADGTPTTDNIDMSRLNAFKFTCDQMPSFDRPVKGKAAGEHDDSILTLSPPNTGQQLKVNWYSAKHHVLTIETCFEITHEAMTPVLQWASGGTVEKSRRDKFEKDNFNDFHTRADNQVLRQNAFMSLVMFDIDKIRIKYRPNGLLCSTPGVSQLFSLIPKLDQCAPVKTRGPLG